MNNQDQIKRSGSSGHDNHGVHLCHKCGWPFQKSHPSAKHRRAHKKVCGTIEGYKLIESDALHTQLSVSDDEHASDEDRRTPSPKVEKRSMKEFVSSGGLRTMSNKSEEDMFLDADTEFPVSGVSQGIEERTREPNKEVEKLLKTGVNESHLLKADATAETSIPLHDTKESSQEVLGIAKDQSEIGKPSHGTRSNEFPIESSGKLALQFHSSHMKFEDPTDVSDDEINAKIDKGTVKEPGVNDNVDDKVDIVLTDSADPHVKPVRDGSAYEFHFEEAGKKASDALIEEREPELEERKGNSSDSVTHEVVVQEPMTTYRNVEQKKDENDVLETNMVNSGVTPLVKPLEDMEDSIADPIQVIGGSGYGKIVDVNDRREEEGKDETQGTDAEKEQEDMMVSDLKEQKEEDAVSNLNEAQKDEIQLQSLTDQKEATNCHLREEEEQNMHSISVPDDLPVRDNFVSMIEGFKDYHTLKSTLPLDLGSAEVIMSSRDKKDIISEESSSTDLNALEHDLDLKGVEKPVDGNDNISGVIIGSGEGGKSCSLEVPTVPLDETQNVIQKEVSSVGFHLQSSENDPLQNAHSEDVVVDKQSTESREVDSGDNNEMNKTEKCVVARNENIKEPLDDELSANILEHADSASIAEDNQIIGSYKEDVNLDHERAEVVGLTIARCESTEVVDDGEKLVKNTEAAEESAERSPESSDLYSVPDKLASTEENTEHTCSSLPKNADESSQGASQVFGTGNITDVLDSVEVSAKGVEGNFDNSLLASNENPVDSTSKEAGPLHVELESSATIEISQAVKSVSDYNSDPSQDEGDIKFGNQHEGVSMIDTSVASSSRADSLEANWGSVSETTPHSDAGSLSFLVSQPPEKLETNLQEDATNEVHPDKSDVFEPPTVVASVESRDYVSQEAALEIQTAPSIQQQEPEDLQAGPAPSITNVENESEVRKEKEEIIAKVSSRSPLKNLLGEANSPISKQVPPATLSDASVPKSNNAAVTTVNAILLSEEPNDHQTPDKEMNKEWNSPARYPSEIKKEKRKGKPYWVPFVCCSSVH